MEPLLRAEHITISYNGKPVVKDVSFELAKGEILGVVGESGSGKSTIIKGIIGLLGGGGMVTRGDIWYCGRNLVDMPQKERRKLLGPSIGMVFQDCEAALCPIRTIGDQIYESIAEHVSEGTKAAEKSGKRRIWQAGSKRISRKEVYEQAAEVMGKIGLDDAKRVLNSYPFELSGGMNQRVGICTAMMYHPSLLLADEPTSALDVTVQRQVVEELKLLRDAYDTAMVIVTHNIGVVNIIADKVLVLQNGKMMDYGPTDRVLHHSENSYTRELMDSVLHLKPEGTTMQEDGKCQRLY